MRNSGFTIIELMIVCAIIAILAISAGPALMNWRGDTSLRSAHMNMKSAIEMGKLRAIKERAPVTVLFGQTGYQIFLDDGIENGAINPILRRDGTRNGQEPLLKGVVLDPPIILTPDAVFNGRVTFDTRGFTVGAVSGDVTLGNGDQERVINISLIGRITTP